MMFYQTSSTATGGATAWQSIGGNVTFDASGQRTSPATQTIAGMTIDGIAVGNINMNFGAGRLTQYGAVEGLATPTLDQDGYAFGTLAGVAVGSDGALTGTYSNGRIAKLAQVAVVHFPSGDALKREDGGTFSVTLGSGTPTQGLLGTTLSGGAVEESNTDISEEFSKMIVTQQAYSANTRVMSTAQQMLQDVINIVR
jgi:flagellar hook protein FlgE